MANPNFVPSFSSDEIWRGQDTNRCISDDLDTIESDILKLKNECENGGDYAPINHNHDKEYSKIDHNHNNEYSNISHNHDNNYAPVDHNHDGKYASVSHTHEKPNITDIGVTISENPAPDTGKPHTIYLQTTNESGATKLDDSYAIMKYEKGWDAYSDYQRPTIYRYGKLRIMYGAIRNTEVKKLSGAMHELAFNIPAEDAPIRTVVSANQHSGNTQFMVEIAGTNVSVGRAPDASSSVGKWWNLYTVWSVA